jgi:hypothetical protein
MKDSKRWKRATASLRRSRHTFGGKLNREDLDVYLDAYYRSDDLERSPGEIDRLVRLYMDNYLYAASPPAEAVLDLYRHCAPELADPNGCSEGEARLRARLQTPILVARRSGAGEAVADR